MSTTKQLVEFIGGPYDGFRYPVALSLDELRREAFLPVTKDIFSLMQGGIRELNAPVTSTAVYKLDSAGAVTRYRFDRCVLPQAAQGKFRRPKLG